ncbi:MAG: ECF transporter S component [Lachnotalea sp.]
MENTQKLQKFVITSMFVAIIFILTFTPIGFIQLGLIKATIIHIPVIIGSILLGPRIGAILGSFFGFASLITNTMIPSLLSFAFSPLIPIPGTDHGSMLALIICFVPRILVGIVPYYVYKLLMKLFSNRKSAEWIALAVAGVAGSMTNTLLVLNLIFFFFQDAFAVVKNISISTVYRAIMLIVAVNGIPEALVASVIITTLGKILLKITKQTNG